MPENIPKYACEYCNFKCSKQSNYKIHLSTDKHIRLTTANDANQINATVFICTCGEQYMHRSSLSRHKKKCTYAKPETMPHENNKCIPQIQQPDSPDLYAIINLLIKENQEIRNLVITQQNTLSDQSKTLADQNKTIVDQNKTLVDQNKTLTEIVKNQQPTMTNSNNTTNSHNNYNINMFLTDKCKDAQNMSDFIEVLKNKIDMFMIEENGYVNGISKLFIQELNSMEITERPLHCTDERRNTFYVHNNDTWNKDENLKDTKKAINHVSHANLQQCLAWSGNVPKGGADREEHITRSIRLCKEANKSSDDDKVDKIIRNISKEIPLNKQVISDILIE
jgi:uncharacterized protein (UPF0216 family)